MIQVKKKDGRLEPFAPQKIVHAIRKSADRAMVKLTTEEENRVVDHVLAGIAQEEIVPIETMHLLVECALDAVAPSVANAYRSYRNYKQDFVRMLDKVYMKSQSVRYIGDRSNANADSALVSTQRSIIYGELNSALYKKFFLNREEREAMEDGYIYIHDRSARLDTINCCLADVQSILSGGFEMGNVWYNEPKTLDTAFDVISDIVVSMAAQQYGGYTIVEVDKLLSPYAQKSYQKYLDECVSLLTEAGISEKDALIRADRYAVEHVRRDFEQGFQGWEYKFNTVGSSRGDYPFITCTFGLGTGQWESMASSIMLSVRKKGQGSEGHKKPVLFPKLVFLYDDNLHGEGKPLEWLFNEAVDCSSKSMYPDFLSLTGNGYVASMYKKYGKVISPMGCRAFLSPWYERGGMNPADDEDEPVFVGRFNLGVVSLNLPMIYAKAQRDSEDFFDVLDYYLELIRGIHKKTYDYLGEKKASTNPLAFCQGGLLGGHLNPDDKIKPLLEPMTMSYGITALNELQELYNKKSVYEDGAFALSVMEHINGVITRYKQEDHILYAIYGTPAESLAGLQVEQFRKLFGIVENVSDRPYVSNSFHCHVTEHITPIQKQNAEVRFWDYFNGGKIQYCKYPIDYNIKAIKTLVRRAMDMGLYEGINLDLAYCESCGHQQLDMDECPVCHSTEITKINRMNG